ncbi:MAG: hypothetical protein WAZ19_12670 [Anaerolineae bacterium]
MTGSTVNLVVKVPVDLRKQARAAAVLRGETIADVVRTALATYIARAGEDDTAFARRTLARIEAGAPTYEHVEVWAELDRLEAGA